MREDTSRRTHKQIRAALLLCLSTGRKTINQIATETSATWKTAELHLTHLAGRGLVQEIFSSEYVRIFALSDKGRDFIRSTLPEQNLIEQHDGATLIKSRAVVR